MVHSPVSLANDSKLCLPGDLNKLAVFPSVTEKRPFQDDLSTKTIISAQSSVTQEKWLEMSSVSWENDSKLCLPGDMNKLAKSSPLSLRNSLFQTILHQNFHIDSKLCLLGEWLEAVSQDSVLNLCLPKT